MSMSSTLTILLSPFLLLISLPLLTFAFFTTTLAFSTLFIRVLIVYIELFAAVTANYITNPQPLNRSPKASNASTPRRRASRRPSLASVRSNSSMTSGSMTPKPTSPVFPPSGSFYMNTAASLTRDFEGVGGWRSASPDTSDNDDVTIASRLEFPSTTFASILSHPTPTTTAHARNHHRSVTSGALSTRDNHVTMTRRAARSPEVGRSRPRTPVSEREDAGWKMGSKSMTALVEAVKGTGTGANMGKARLGGGRKGSTSESSTVMNGE